MTLVSPQQQDRPEPDIFAQIMNLSAGSELPSTEI
jgi:hypothetical protein